MARYYLDALGSQYRTGTQLQTQPEMTALWAQCSDRIIQRAIVLYAQVQVSQLHALGHRVERCHTAAKDIVILFHPFHGNGISRQIPASLSFQAVEGEKWLECEYFSPPSEDANIHIYDSSTAPTYVTSNSYPRIPHRTLLEAILEILEAKCIEARAILGSW